jgi:hypothetical protein
VIRRCLWPIEAEEKAANALKQYFKNKGKPTPEIYENEIKKRIPKALEKIGYKWYPKCWLTFIYKARPGIII